MSQPQQPWQPPQGQPQYDPRTGQPIYQQGQMAPGMHPGGMMPPDRQAFVSNKVAAGICGILLGGLGIHKFILGLTTPGVVMILLSVVVGTLTCGIGWGVMSIIGIIEGVIYLTKSDDQFYNDYAIQKKGWF